MKRFIAAALAIAALVLTTTSPARAGYRLEEIDPEFPGEVTTTVFQAGKARIDGALEGLTIVVDVKGGEGWLIDKALKRYAGGPLAKLAEELRKLEEQDLAEAAAEAREASGEEPGEETAEETGAAEESAPEPEKPRSIEVKDAGAGEKLLGYETRRHQVFVDGELLEELWIAPKLEIAKEIDLAAFSTAMQQMLGGGLSAGQGYEESPAYLALRASGYPLRQVLYFVGEKSTLSVTSVTQQTFPAEDFAVPKGFARIGYAELLLGEGE